MPKIVDKEKKREEIAMRSFEFLLENGMVTFNINSIIHFLKMGKGSFYNYFSSRDELLIEILNHLVDHEYTKVKENLLSAKSLKERLYIIYDIYLRDDEESRLVLALIREVFSMFIDENSSTRMSNSSHKYFRLISSLVKEAIEVEIKSDNIKKESIDFVIPFISAVEGVQIFSYSIKELDLKKEIINLIETTVKLMQK
jgi:AcrR family transcriptional regulator